MTLNDLPLYSNGQVIELDVVPRLPIEQFRSAIIELMNHKHGHCIAFYAMPNVHDQSQLHLVVIIGFRDQKKFMPLFSENLSTPFYQSLTPDVAALHHFEREIAEQWGITPIGHPWLKPIRFHHAYRYHEGVNDPFGRTKNNYIAVGVMPFFQIPSSDIHEVGVGPVHAGVIEPGHFRFQCHGETVFNLEISLGYQHRGIERMLVGGPYSNTIGLIETIAGDSTIAHTINYARIIEALAEIQPTEKGKVIRSILLELERLANHTGDIGALSSDVAFLPTSSFCGRIRGDFLNHTGSICGNRFGRRAIIPGGTSCNISDANISSLATKLRKSSFDVDHAVKTLWDTPSALERLETCGTITKAFCQELGIVGIAARATGLKIDARTDYPSDLYEKQLYSPQITQDGDAEARAFVRWLEIQSSCSTIINALANFPDGENCAKEKYNDSKKLKPFSMVISLTEAWRGESAHVVITNALGRFHHYKVVDPSFHNWFALAQSLRNEHIYNFPICNKSFNLSYCGHDL